MTGRATLPRTPPIKHQVLLETFGEHILEIWLTYATGLQQLILNCQQQLLQKDREENRGEDATNSQAAYGDQGCVMNLVKKKQPLRSHHGEPINKGTLQGLQDLVSAGNQLGSMEIVSINGMSFGANTLRSRLKMIFGMNLHLVNGLSRNISDSYIIEENAWGEAVRI